MGINRGVLALVILFALSDCLALYLSARELRRLDVKGDGGFARELAMLLTVFAVDKGITAISLIIWPMPPARVDWPSLVRLLARVIATFWAWRYYFRILRR